MQHHIPAVDWVSPLGLFTSRRHLHSLHCCGVEYVGLRCVQCPWSRAQSLSTFCHHSRRLAFTKHVLLDQKMLQALFQQCSSKDFSALQGVAGRLHAVAIAMLSLLCTVTPDTVWQLSCSIAPWTVSACLACRINTLIFYAPQLFLALGVSHPYLGLILASCDLFYSICLPPHIVLCAEAMSLCLHAMLFVQLLPTRVLPAKPFLGCFWAGGDVMVC